MYGIEAITASNGWSMALAGVIIVFSGLVLLSLTIAQFHKVMNLLENRDLPPGPQSADAGPAVPLPSPQLTESARPFRLLSERLGEPFPLPKLLELAELSGYFLWKF